MVQLLHHRQLGGDGGVFFLEFRRGGAVQQGVDLFIHALDAAADDSLDKLVLADVAVVVQLHQAGEGKPGLVLVQAADAVGQLPGQHGDDLVGIVDAGGTLKGLVVQCGAGLDVVADVGDVDAQLVAAAVELEQADGVVDVLGLGRVDGEDGQPPQVHAVGDLLLSDAGAGEGAGFLQHLLREVLAHLAAVKDGLGALGRNVRGAEPLADGHPVLRMAAAAQGQFRAGLVAGAHALVLAFLNQQLDAVAAVRLQGQAAVLGADDGAGDGIVGLGDLGHLALGAALHAGVVKQADVDLVLGHGAVQRAAGDKDVALAVVTAGKSETGRQLDQRAGDGGGHVLVLDGGKAGGVFALFHRQRAVGHHSRNGIAQTVSVHLQFVLQLPQAAGPAGNGFQDIFLQNCHCCYSSLTSPCRPAGPFRWGAAPRRPTRTASALVILCILYRSVSIHNKRSAGKSGPSFAF